MTPIPIRRLLLVVDAYGIPELLHWILRDHVVGIAAVVTKRRYLLELQALAQSHRLVSALGMVKKPWHSDPVYCLFPWPSLA